MRLLAAFCALLLITGTVHAQHETEPAPMALVQYTLEASLTAPPEQAFTHPAISMFSRQEALLNLDVASQGQRLEMKATFRFGSMAQFQAWYEADETQALLRVLGEEAEPRAHLALQRLR